MSIERLSLLVALCNISHHSVMSHHKTNDDISSTYYSNNLCTVSSCLLVFYLIYSNPCDRNNLRGEHKPFILIILFCSQHVYNECMYSVIGLKLLETFFYFFRKEKFTFFYRLLSDFFKSAYNFDVKI